VSRRLAVVIGALVIGAVAGGFTVAATGRRSADPSMHPVAVSTAPIVRTDLVSTVTANGTLGFAPTDPVVNRIDGTYTALPPPGQVITNGGTLYDVDAVPVVLMLGNTPAYRPFGPGMTDGPDVAELEADLVALGDDPGRHIRVDDHFDWATAAAIGRWQRAIGIDASSPTVPLGRVVFLATPIRVGAHLAAPGQSTGPSSPYEAGSTTPIVTVALDASRQDQVPVGSQVTIDLLDGHTTTGTIQSVEPAATAPSAGGGATGDQNQASSNDATLNVTITLPAGPKTTAGAPVRVALVTARRHAVLAVPVTALLALAEGGYGVELVDHAGRHHLVAATTGLFANTLVEVSGPGLAVGERVVTAQ
jgi:hypothetical protein